MTRPKKVRVAPKQGYHHQSLRRALLDAAINHLATGDLTTLSIQTLARAAKVSPGAPYHHFPDKPALLGALATEGWELWLQRATSAVREGDPPRVQLEALSLAWLRFARSHPSHYRVMLLPEVADRKRFVALHETSGKSLALLVGILARGLPEVSLEDLASRAIVAWSTLHGFASLEGAGVLTNIPGMPKLASLEQSAAHLTAHMSLLTPERMERA